MVVLILKLFITSCVAKFILFNEWNCEWKTSENRKFSDVFKGYRNVTLD